MSDAPDIVIIGSGMGGATLAAALAPMGLSILMLERGEYLKETSDFADDEAIFGRKVFRSGEPWRTPDGSPFHPGNFYNVGGNSKFYGCVMFRYRAKDFAETQHLGGTSPAWPLSYDDMAPWYDRAEALYKVRGQAGEDPTEPHRSGAYPNGPVPDEPTIADLRKRLAAAGVTPASLPLALDGEAWMRNRTGTWDGHPDTSGAKLDAQSVGIAKAAENPNFTLLTGARVTRLVAGASGRIKALRYQKEGREHLLSPRLVILSAGAVNSAALLLSSADEAHPTGLANQSGLVGRRFMNHNCTAIMALHPFRKNSAAYQKTLYFNDFYLTGGPGGAPLGNVQLLGKITAPILQAETALPKAAATWLAARSVDWYVMSEDLPSHESRVTVRGEDIILNWQRSNIAAHEILVRKTRKIMRRAGFPVQFSRSFDARTPSHQCGTAVFGVDPGKSVLTLESRAHDHENLFVVDASFLPTSAAVNPALTIAAQALRAARHIEKMDLRA